MMSGMGAGHRRKGVFLPERSERFSTKPVMKFTALRGLCAFAITACSPTAAKPTPCPPAARLWDNWRRHLRPSPRASRSGCRGGRASTSRAVRPVATNPWSAVLCRWGSAGTATETRQRFTHKAPWSAIASISIPQPVAGRGDPPAAAIGHVRATAQPRSASSTESAGLRPAMTSA